MRKLWILVFVVLLPACVFKAETAKKQALKDNCKKTMTTKKQVLKMETIDNFNLSVCNGTNNGSALACMAAVSTILPAASLILSGSVVLIGNTVHWIEYQTSC